MEPNPQGRPRDPRRPYSPDRPAHLPVVVRRRHLAAGLAIAPGLQPARAPALAPPLAEPRPADAAPAVPVGTARLAGDRSLAVRARTRARGSRAQRRARAPLAPRRHRDACRHPAEAGTQAPARKLPRSRIPHPGDDPRRRHPPPATLAAERAGQPAGPMENHRRPSHFAAPAWRGRRRDRRLALRRQPGNRLRQRARRASRRLRRL